MVIYIWYVLSKTTVQSTNMTGILHLNTCKEVPLDIELFFSRFLSVKRRVVEYSLPDIALYSEWSPCQTVEQWNNGRNLYKMRLFAFGHGLLVKGFGISPQLLYISELIALSFHCFYTRHWECRWSNFEPGRLPVFLAWRKSLLFIEKLDYVRLVLVL